MKNFFKFMLVGLFAIGVVACKEGDSSSSDEGSSIEESSAISGEEQMPAVEQVEKSESTEEVSPE